MRSVRLKLASVSQHLTQKMFQTNNQIPFGFWAFFQQMGPRRQASQASAFRCLNRGRGRCRRCRCRRCLVHMENTSRFRYKITKNAGNVDIAMSCLPAIFLGMVNIPTIYGDEWGMVYYCYTNIIEQTKIGIEGTAPSFKQLGKNGKTGMYPLV